MAGPLRPRWVMRIFSRKAGGVVRVRLGAGVVAMASVERPLRSHQSLGIVWVED